MRTPDNDTASVTDRTDGRAGDDPVRTCILSREHASRAALLRLALSPDGDVLPDVRAKAPGRGAWVGVGQAELADAVANGRLKGQLSRAFKTGAVRVPDDLADRVATALMRAALDRLGLEAKAGHVVIGTTAIDKAARSGRLHALYHAADAADDGAAKLAQAWRVGSEREGSGLTGLALPVGRTILSLALGRENVVHVGVTDGPAARRAGEAIARWLQFIGPEPLSSPCETRSQGASTARSAAADPTTTKQELE